MSGNVSLGYWSHENSHSSSHNLIANTISEEESTEVYLDRERHGHRSFDNIHSYFRNIGGQVQRFLETSHYSSRKCGGNNSSYFGREGSRAQDTSRYSSHNYGTRVDIEGKGGYISQTIHYYLHKPGDCGILLTSLVYSCPVDENVYGKDKGYIRFYDGDGRINISCDDGNTRGI